MKLKTLFQGRLLFDFDDFFTNKKQQRLSLNILIYYLHSCIYFINISAPGKQNVNVTRPVVYTSGLNSILWQIGFANKRNPLY
jgi:hypothetical protein